MREESKRKKDIHMLLADMKYIVPLKYLAIPVCKEKGIRASSGYAVWVMIQRKISVGMND